jgi:hypothetical protein
MMDTILHILSKDTGDKPAKKAKGNERDATSALDARTG